MDLITHAEAHYMKMSEVTSPIYSAVYNPAYRHCERKGRSLIIGHDNSVKQQVSNIILLDVVVSYLILLHWIRVQSVGGCWLMQFSFQFLYIEDL